MKRTHLKSPKYAKRLLESFLRDDLVEEVCGDLEEKFYSSLEQRSLFRARLSYWFQVLNYLRPFAIRKSSASYLNQYVMWESYFKIGWRSLTKQSFYSGIKIGGFAVGIAACLLIALFVHQELSYDQHYANVDRIYRVWRQSEFRGESGKGIHFPAPLAEALEEDYPEFELVGHYNAVENFGAGSNEVRRVDQTESSHEDALIYADQNLIEILEFPFIYGSPKNALTEPNTIVLTRRKAEKYFPGEDPTGKLLILNNNEKRQYRVTGVVLDPPVNSHLPYDFYMSLGGAAVWPRHQTDWRSSNYVDYALVRPGTDIHQLEIKLSSLLKKYFIPAAGDAESVEWIKSFRFKLQPVRDIYLNTEGVNYDYLRHGDLGYIWLFTAVAAFILLIACINFINLSTAKSANRAREVGLRKVVGSLRSGLIAQFLTESLIYSFFACSLGLFLAWLALPYFNYLVSKSLIFPWQEWWLLPLVAGSALSVGILAGLYPAFYLSSFKPVHVLKGNVSRGSRNSSTRSALVVFQFTVSIVLVIGTFVINRQMNYILNKKIGFDKEQVLLLQGAHTLGDKVLTLKNELLRLPEVRSVSISGFLPVDGAKRDNGGWSSEGMKENEHISGQQWSVEHDYIKTLGLRIVAGRDFSQGMPSDSQAVVINQSLAKAFNFEEPIGQRIYNWLGGWTVIGVVEDFHFESMKAGIRPLGMYIRKSWNTVSVKVNTNEMPATLESITAVWKQFSPNQSIRYTFLDQRYAQMYEEVERMGQIFSSFALLAIVIACLGLFALSTFMVEQRNKEICIRLVLGASVNSIFQLLTRNFVKLVLISFAIAAPIAWFMTQKWLEDYVYKIELGWDIFLLAGVMAMLIALFTISYQSIRAALMNPVESLKSE